METKSVPADNSVRERLLEAAFECFLDNDYHQVSTRIIAEKAHANVSMIRYYFFNKEGLYQEMLIQALQPLIDILDNRKLEEDPSIFLNACYQLLPKQQGLTKLMLKALSVEKGPGRDIIDRIFSRMVNHGSLSKEVIGESGQSAVERGVVKMTLLSFILTPILLKDAFEKNSSYSLDSEFLQKLANLSGQLLVR